MRPSQLTIKNYMWTLIKDATSCIWERLEFYSENKNRLSKGFSLNYNSSNFHKSQSNKKIIFEVFFTNKENVFAKTEKMSDREYFITIYLPNVFGFRGKGKKITKNKTKEILEQKLINIRKLVRTISHEITHVFDPLFNNIFYTEYYVNKCKRFIDSIEKENKINRNFSRELYFDSVIEINALIGEIESEIRILRNSGTSKEDSINLLLNSIDDSEFEKHLKINRPFEWARIEKKIKELIDFFYSEEKFLFI